MNGDTPELREGKADLAIMAVGNHSVTWTPSLPESISGEFKEGPPESEQPSKKGPEGLNSKFLGMTATSGFGLVFQPELLQVSPKFQL